MLFVIVLLIVLLVAANMLRGFFRSRLDRRTVPVLDLNRYMGTWYEIARLENRFERGMVAVSAQYKLLDDGSVEVVNNGVCPLTGERKTSLGRAHKTDEPGRFKVSFAGLFSSEYNVLELDGNYEWALVGSHSAEYLWILSRTPSLAKETVEDLKIKAQERGYNIEQILLVDQSANLR